MLVWPVVLNRFHCTWFLVYLFNYPLHPCVPCDQMVQHGTYPTVYQSSGTFCTSQWVVLLLEKITCAMQYHRDIVHYRDYIGGLQLVCTPGLLDRCQLIFGLPFSLLDDSFALSSCKWPYHKSGLSFWPRSWYQQSRWWWGNSQCW